MQETNEALLHTYNRFRLCWTMVTVHICMIQKERNIWILQQDMRCLRLGYSNQELNEALKDQIDKLIHTSNLYYNTYVEKQQKI